MNEDEQIFCRPDRSNLVTKSILSGVPSNDKMLNDYENRIFGTTISDQYLNYNNLDFRYDKTNYVGAGKSKDFLYNNTYITRMFMDKIEKLSNVYGITEYIIVPSYYNNAFVANQQFMLVSKNEFAHDFPELSGYLDKYFPYTTVGDVTIGFIGLDNKTYTYDLNVLNLLPVADLVISDDNNIFKIFQVFGKNSQIIDDILNIIASNHGLNTQISYETFVLEATAEIKCHTMMKSLQMLAEQLKDVIKNRYL